MAQRAVVARRHGPCLVFRRPRPRLWRVGPGGAGRLPVPSAALTVRPRLPHLSAHSDSPHLDLPRPASWAADIVHRTYRGKSPALPGDPEMVPQRLLKSLAGILVLAALA